MFKITLERLIGNYSNPSALEKEIEIMKKWSADEAYEALQIEGSSPARILKSAKPKVRESVEWILLEEFKPTSKNEFKPGYDGSYLMDRLTQEILSLENIITKFKNTEKEAQRLLDYMIEYSP